MRRAWVRGVGAITPLGDTWPESVRALAEGRTAVAPVTVFDATGFPCTAAAAIDRAFPETEDRRLALARIAAREAWTNANLQNPGRIGIFIGSESGRASPRTVLELSRAAGGGTAFDHQAFGRNARVLAERFDPSVVSPATVASHLAGELEATGPVRTISLACASGAAAIAEAVRAIRQGLCDVALCGGVGADVDPLMLAGFGLLGALSARGVSCPFDAKRDGFVVGEGAAMIVLSCEPGDGARIEVAGLGRTLDAHHLTAPDPTGNGAIRTMRLALDDAGLDAVDYVQAHGTSTPLNDQVEATAIRAVLADKLDRAHVGAVKGALGHWIAGAGALGFLCGFEAVAHGTLLPTAGLVEQDPACALPHVRGRAIAQVASAALVNAFAFGGANCSLVLRREA